MNENRGLWRGKRVDNGEWIEGYLYGQKNGKWYLYDRFCETYEVDPETLGECTGITDDINKNLIFEGDIVHCISRLDNANCVVIFEEGEFRLVPVRYYKTYTTRGGYHAVRCFEKEVIGNIHDNPELLAEKSRP